MRTPLIIATSAFLIHAMILPVQAQTAGAISASGDLLLVCQEADSDSRWGGTAELECETYIMGFVGALETTGSDEEAGICLPEENTADEVRWAFTRWVHASFSKRKKLPASEALFATLKENFACQ